MHEPKIELKISDQGKFVNSLEFRPDPVPSFRLDLMEKEKERLKGEISTQYKGKPIHASLFAYDVKTEFSFDDIGQLMVHHIDKVDSYFQDYYRYLQTLSGIWPLIIAILNTGGGDIQGLSLSVSFPSFLKLYKPGALPSKPRFTIFDRIPGFVHAMVEDSFFRLLQFKDDEDSARFRGGLGKKEKEIGQFYGRKFQGWEKEGSVVKAAFPKLGENKKAYLPICIEIPDKPPVASFSVACKAGAENIAGSVEEEFRVSLA